MEQKQFSFQGEQKVLSVSEIVSDVKAELESRLHDVWVQGEVSNLRTPPSGHLYFTLKDDQAQISAVCFRLQARLLKFTVEDGLDVLARGTVTVYPPRGQLQLRVEFMEPQGRGALQLAFEQLKVRLEAEGLFDPAHKSVLPSYPKKIAIVTSPSGAAVRDILKVLERRNDSVDVLIYPTRVQGATAGQEIAAGIRYLNTRSDIDTIIVGRGGGSLEDLWAFNEEVLARTIYESRIPIISAVGHEIDFTIADFVADLRAPTPSAAAEIVCAKRGEISEQLSQLNRRAYQAIRFELQRLTQKYSSLLRSRGFVEAESRLRFLIQRLDELEYRLQQTLAPILSRNLTALERLTREASYQMTLQLRARRSSLTGLEEKLQAFSPLQVLKRGYAIATKIDGTIIRDPGQVSSEETFQITVARGDFLARKEGGNGD